jgi:hypothetical protein
MVKGNIFLEDDNNMADGSAGWEVIVIGSHRWSPDHAA